MSVLRARHWSPYAVGFGIGVLSWFAFATAGGGLGITTPFEHSAALALATIVPAGEAMRSYLAAHAPRIGWEWMLVIGVALGSHVSARLSGDRRHAVVPALWRERFGDSPAFRMGVTFAGRRDHDDRCAAGARVHERPRHHRRPPTRGRELAVHHARVGDCDRDRRAALSPLAPAGDGSGMTIEPPVRLLLGLLTGIAFGFHRH